MSFKTQDHLSVMFASAGLEGVQVLHIQPVITDHYRVLLQSIVQWKKPNGMLLISTVADFVN